MQSTSHRRVRWLLALVPLLLAGKCGPSPQQAGATALMSAFLAFTAVGLLLWVLVALWNRFIEPTQGDWRGWWRAWGVLLCMALVTLVAGPSGSAEWTGFGFMLLGSFILLYTLMIWRWQRQRYEIVWLAPAVILVLACLPAVPLLLGASLDPLILIWVYGSGAMWGGPAMLVILLFEILVRARMRDAQSK